MSVNPSDETLRFMNQQIETNKDLKISIVEVRDLMIEMRGDLKGIHEQTKKTNGRVGALELWKNENDEMIKDIREERKDNTRNLRRIAWNIIQLIIVGVLSAFLTFVSITNLFS